MTAPVFNARTCARGSSARPNSTVTSRGRSNMRSRLGAVSLRSSETSGPSGAGPMSMAGAEGASRGASGAGASCSAGLLLSA